MSNGGLENWKRTQDGTPPIQAWLTVDRTGDQIQSVQLDLCLLLGKSWSEITKEYRADAQFDFSEGRFTLRLEHPSK